MSRVSKTTEYEITSAVSVKRVDGHRGPEVWLHVNTELVFLRPSEAEEIASALKSVAESVSAERMKRDAECS